MSKISFKKRLWLLTIIPCFMLIAAGVFSLYALKQSQSYTQKLYKHPFTVANTLQTIKADILAMQLKLKQIENTTSLTQVKNLKAEIFDTDSKLDQNLNILFDRFLGDKTKIQETKDLIEEWKNTRNKSIELVISSLKTEQKFYPKNEPRKVLRQLLENLEENNDFANKKAQNFFELSINNVKKDTMYSIYFYLFVLIATFVFALITIQSLSKKMKSVLQTLVDNSEQIQNASQEIAESSGILTDSSAQAAANLQETVASMDEISAMVNRNAESAQTSSDASDDGQTHAEQGKQRVQEMISSIHEISESNDKIALEMKDSNDKIAEIVDVIGNISEKTKVINDIVFQTKLLSFNASVEAARAGEHGKGFAVVAEEVGNLASMSGTAANEISEMLEQSVSKVNKIVQETQTSIERLVQDGKNKVKAGEENAEKCGEALEQILHSARKVRGMVDEIATASKEQSTGIAEINRAIQALDEITSKNNTIAIESKGQAVDLDNKAQNLNVLVCELMHFMGTEDQLKEKRCKDTEMDSLVSSAAILTEDENLVAATEVENVISFQSSKETESLSQKASGGEDLGIPDANDPRFEDI